MSPRSTTIDHGSRVTMRDPLKLSRPLLLPHVFIARPSASPTHFVNVFCKSIPAAVRHASLSPASSSSSARPAVFFFSPRNTFPEQRNATRADLASVIPLARLRGKATTVRVYVYKVRRVSDDHRNSIEQRVLSRRFDALSSRDYSRENIYPDVGKIYMAHLP